MLRMDLMTFAVPAFMAMGAYSAAIAGLRCGITDTILLAALSFAVPALVALPLGAMVLRLRGVYFVLVTFLFFTLFPVTLVWADSFGWLALAFVVRGLKEFGEPARKALIIGEAVPALRARTYGAYYLIRDCVVTTGSFLGAWLWSISPRANFIGAAVCGALGTIWFWWFIYRRKPATGLTDGQKRAESAPASL